MGYDFATKADIQRVADATRRVEKMVRDVGGRRNALQAVPTPGGVGVLNAQLDRGTLTAPESASINIYAWDESTSAYVDTEETLTIYDVGFAPTAGAASGDTVYFAFRGGVPLFDGTPCNG